MRSCTKRWLYLLAGSAMSAREIRDMCVWLAGENRDDIVALVTKLRREELAPAVTDTVGVVPSNLPMGPGGAGGPDALGDLTAEIAFVLRTESHLTAREAAIRLAAELKKEGNLGSEKGVTAQLPVYSKESFHVYVGKLLKHASPQMLLHVAHRIRDGIVDRQRSAWPLRDRVG